MADHFLENERSRIIDQIRLLETENSEDLETVTRILSKLTHVPAEEIRPQLQGLMSNLLNSRSIQTSATMTPEVWKQQFTAWVEGHRDLELPSLSDEAMSRESIYGDDR